MEDTGIVPGFWTVSQPEEYSNKPFFVIAFYFE